RCWTGERARSSPISPSSFLLHAFEQSLRFCRSRRGLSSGHWDGLGGQVGTPHGAMRVQQVYQAPRANRTTDRKKSLGGTCVLQRQRDAPAADRKKVVTPFPIGYPGQGDSGSATPCQGLANKELLEEVRRLAPDEMRLMEMRLEGREWADIAAELGGSPE